MNEIANLLPPIGLFLWLAVAVIAAWCYAEEMMRRDD